jgi:glycosyltransferase 2 family protein
MSKSNKVKELFTFKRLAIPIVISLAVAFYMLWSNTDWDKLSEVHWGIKTFLWMLVGLMMMAIRDLAYMYRIWILTDKQISWRNSFDVIMLWEFSSAVTPGIVGGTGVALYILNKEGLSGGKSTAMVMLTALFDQLFYVVTVPIVILIIGTQYLFPIELQKEIFGVIFSVKGIFVLGYCVTLMFSLVFSFGIFIKPQGLKKLLLLIFRLKFLRKWQPKMNKVGDDIILTSAEFRSKSFLFWFKAATATFFAWTARFWLVNFLILAFTPVGEHFLIYGRQLVMWLVMVVFPTPGGTGVAEFAFTGFLADFIPVGLVGILAVIWRLASYYPYLFIGILVIPKWLKRVYS